MSSDSLQVLLQELFRSVYDQLMEKEVSPVAAAELKSAAIMLNIC